MPAPESVAIPTLERRNGDLSNQRIVVRRCGHLYGRPGSGIAARQAQKYGNRPVTHVGTRIRRDHSAQHRYDIGDAELHCTTLFTGQSMERQLPHRRDRIIERREKCVR